VTDHADVICLERVRKEFGSFVAVQHADFGIRRGEFFALLGPSGCGKTTLLRMIAGFEQPTTGRVLLDGADQAGVPPHKRNVNTVFQQYALFPHMSVFDNVAFGPRSKGRSESELRPKVHEMLEIVRLDDKADRRPMQLSGGQQQRVALARALVNLPSALLLDEPLAALDLKLRQAMQIELKRIQREVGITFVFVTHDQEEALTMSDRIAVMSQGRVEQIGTPDEIYNTPASVFVAGFIGTANLLRATLREATGAGSVVQLESGQRIRGTAIDAAPGDPVTVMLRPERLVPSVEAPREGGGVQGTVSDVIFQGASSRVLLRLADDTEIVTHVEAEDHLPFLRPGDPLWVSWGDDAVYALRGWPAHAGATTTNVDQVQAQLDGRELVAGGAAHDAARTTPERTMSRRGLLIGAGAIGVVAVGGIIAAVASGGDESDSTSPTSPPSSPPPSSPPTPTTGTTTEPTPTTAAVPTTEGGPPPSGPEPGSTVRILNWILYIEEDKPETSPTLKGFTAATGLKVSYRSELDDNDAFYEKFQADMAVGRDIGFDIVVPTSWMAARLVSEGLVEPFDDRLMPNKVNIRADMADPAWDPGRRFSLPWAQGQTGIAYFPEKTGRPITAISDLLDPKFKNRVSILSEWRDTIGLFLLDAGVEPTTATMDQIRAALAVIKEAQDAGQFRKVSGNSYTDDLITGEVWLAIGWSGDIASLKAVDRPEIEYVLPEKGAMSFVDNCLIPLGAKNKAGAEVFLNHVYDPAVSGPLFEAITYVSPVEGATAFMTAAGQTNPFVNPPPGARLYEFRDVTEAEEEEIVTLFAEATQL